MSSDSSDIIRSISYFDWEEFLTRHQEPIFVPGLRPSPPSPRLSSLTKRQHEQCLTVLCYTNPHILPNRFMRRPTTQDYAVFEEVKQQYLQEQQEYIDWAKALWVNGHNLRALQPSVAIENVYLTEFNVRVSQVRDYPMRYQGTITISLDTGGTFEMKRLETFQDVNTSNLPQLQYPESIDVRLTLQPTGDVLKPCAVHPVRFVLPGQRAVTNLVATEVHTQLAEYAGARGVPFVAREAALRCLVESRYWALTVSVCAVRWKDGQTRNVVVLGSEMTYKPEDPMTRTFRAYKRLLENAFVPPSELSKWSLDPDDSDTEGVASNDAIINANNGNTNIAWTEHYVPSNKHEDHELFVFDAVVKKEKGKDMCTCKDTVFGQPPPRSFRRWQLRSTKLSDNVTVDVIVHCAHKFRGDKGEVLLEPICEYQAELGASNQTDDRLKGMALALALRDEATGVVNVRIDVQSGDVITIEELSEDQLNELKSPERLAAGGTAIHSTLNRLQVYEPGHYLLIHDSSDGDYALLYTEGCCYDQPCEMASRDAECSRNAGSSSDLSSSDEQSPSHKDSSGDADCSHDEDSSSDADSSSEAGYSRVMGFSHDIGDVDADYLLDAEENWSREANADCSRDADADCSRDADADCSRDADADCSRDADADWTPEANAAWSGDANADCSHVVDVDWLREAKAHCSRDVAVDWLREAKADCSRNTEAACSLDADAAYSLDADADWSREANASCSRDADADCFRDPNADSYRDLNADCFRDTNADCFRDVNIDCSRDAAWKPNQEDKRYAAWWHRVGYSRNVGFSSDLGSWHKAGWSSNLCSMRNVDLSRNASFIDATYSHNAASMRNAVYSRNAASSRNTASSRMANSMRDAVSTRDATSSRNITFSSNAVSSRNAASTRDAASSRNATSSRDAASLRDAASTHTAASSRDAASTRTAASTRDAASSRAADSSSDDGDQRNPGSSPTLPTPVLGPALLPYHKFRKILPCAFTYGPEHVIEELRQTGPTVKAPPKPIQWTKKKRGKKNLRPH